MPKPFNHLLNEFSTRGGECWLYTSSYDTKWHCKLKIEKDGDELEFKDNGLDAESAFHAAYRKYSRLIERIPQYNPNLLIESEVNEDA